MTTMTQQLSTLELFRAGQSPWLDNISRELIRSGNLRKLILEKGLLGVTSNPSIFEKAIGSSGGAYDRDIAKMTARGASVFEVYDALTISDIQSACDLFLPVFRKTKGEHGFVSLEVSPDLSGETEATLLEARRLFKRVNRPNVMIKIPATPEGIPAIQAAIGEGININVTLMFSIQHYRDVAHAYIDGLKAFRKKGGDLSRVHSVASVFVSRIDSLIDKKLDGMITASRDSSERKILEGLKGKAAIANSRLIYQEFKRIFACEDFHLLKALGARIQKPLWGSTSTKNPDYPDLMYVETLVGKDTVNTLPQNTLEALLDHGSIQPDTIENNLAEASEVVSGLKKLGMDLLQLGEKLQKDGVDAFVQSFDQLMKTLELKRSGRSSRNKKRSRVSPVQFFLPEKKLKESIGSRKASFVSADFTGRFFRKEASLWKSEPEHQKVILNRLGWQTAHDWILGKLYSLDQLKDQLTREKIRDIILLGMGGSSLAPEVLNLIVRPGAKAPRLHVLDTTDPASISVVEKKILLKKSLFIVASKSGGTIETLSQFRYFYDRLARLYRKNKKSGAGRHFIAITDPGSGLEQLSRERVFRKVFLNPPDIGGRYSALSLFGMAPAAMLGMDVREIGQSARQLFSEAQQKDFTRNSSFALGIVLGEFALAGYDKMTLLTSPRLASFGTWLEQLVAESTGKEGRGIIPVEGERLLEPSAYGKDRFFVSLRLRGDQSPALDKQLTNLKKAGFPVVEIEWTSVCEIGAEFLRWEIATSVASAVLGVNPFDEPNVKESKDNTGLILSGLARSGQLKDPGGMIGVTNGKELGTFLKKVPAGGYIALLAYVDRSKETQKILDEIRKAVAVQYNVPVLVGFGPRYLHSIGQLYKGGPRTGLFLELLVRDKKDLRVPGEKYTFGQLKKAQALGDMKALEDKGLSFLSVDLGANALSGLKALKFAVTSK